MLRRLCQCACWLKLAARCTAIVALAAGSVARAAAPSAASPEGPDRAFLQTRCFDCHQGKDAEGGLDLSSLSRDLTDPKSQARWVRIVDRVEAGEMPPPDAGKLPPQEAAAFVQETGDWLRAFQRSQDEQFGRVRGRRLTRRELERSLQDLLGIDIPLADQLPEEASSNEFSTVADGQAMSHFQLERHLAVVDAALDEAFRRALSPPDRYDRDFDALAVARRPDRRRTREPEVLDGRAVTWSSGLIFYGRLPATTAPEDGWYRFRVRASGLKPPNSGGVWCTVRSGLCVSSAPLLAWITALEATEQPRDIEFEAWLPKGHMLEIRPGDATLKRARFAGGQVGNGEGGPQNVPGIAIDRITMQRIHRGPDDDGVRRLLFGDLSLQPQPRGRQFTLESQNPRDDAARLLEDFACRAFRRPVSREQIAGYLGMVQATLDEGEDLVAALRVGYRAVLCSPRFLYLTETPGRLDDHAIAARLSYLLTGSTPDERLTQLADAGKLHEPAAIRGEVERLLSGRGGRRFVEDFAAEWLDLDQIDFTEPDGKLYPGFDAIVQQSMLEETRTFLETMLRDNLSVTNLIASDFTFLNSRLARFYEIGGVSGDELRAVALKPQDRRGGVLTQGAILKVTANGSNTSPVVRGVWVSERLLGVPIPPPPGNVPAIEPDIRGARTIREMLAKHRSQDSCASCHVKIDPPGFALENYDPAGRWQDRYVQLIGGRRESGAKVDASYELPDGRKFEDVDEFRSLVVAQPHRLARNVAEKLLVYGTGAPISYADRRAVEEIAHQSAADNYGFRSLVHAVVISPVFLSK
jgi:mono/diheme cytochrome c family protein